MSKRKEALKEIAETAAFWEQVFNEEALLSDDGGRPYANPWFPVEFARKIRELAECSLE